MRGWREVGGGCEGEGLAANVVSHLSPASGKVPSPDRQRHRPTFLGALFVSLDLSLHSSSRDSKAEVSVGFRCF